MLNTPNARNVVDLRSYRDARQVITEAACGRSISARCCRHCGAALMDGEADDDCSSLGIGDAAPAARRFYAE